jgi:hypothetical protein
MSNRIITPPDIQIAMFEELEAARDVVQAAEGLFAIMDAGPMQGMIRSAPFGVLRSALVRYKAVELSRPGGREGETEL